MTDSCGSQPKEITEFEFDCVHGDFESEFRGWIRGWRGEEVLLLAEVDEMVENGFSSGVATTPRPCPFRVIISVGH